MKYNSPFLVYQYISQKTRYMWDGLGVYTYWSSNLKSIMVTRILFCISCIAIENHSYTCFSNFIHSLYGNQRLIDLSNLFNSWINMLRLYMSRINDKIPFFQFVDGTV